MIDRLLSFSCTFRWRLSLPVVTLGFLFLPLAGDQSFQSRQAFSPPRDVSHAQLPIVFASARYDLSGIRDGDKGVPRIRVSKLPQSLSKTLSRDGRKNLFFKTMLPMILQANERIISERQHLREILARSYNGKRMRTADRAWVLQLANRYKTNPKDVHELLARLDVVPPSLALGQGVVESGWGMDGLAGEKNSPFGHRVSVTEFRPRGGRVQRYKLKTFDSLSAAIEAYVHNINTHPAYEELRKLRAGMRKRGAAINGYHLASGLTKYSELGIIYVRQVQSIIHQNGLTQFDAAFLDHDPS